MYHGYVSWLCIMGMYHGYVSWVCNMAMYHGYVSWLCIMAMYLVKGLTKYSRSGLLGEIFDKLRIQGRMQIFERKSQSALNHVLTL